MQNDPKERAASCRRFSLLDALMVIAAAALGLCGYRVNNAQMTESGFYRGEYLIPEGWEMLVGPGLASLTAGLLIARLLRPRPSRIRIFRQPGFVAGCLVLALSAHRFLEGMLLDRLIEYDDWTLPMEWQGSLHEASLGLLVTWSVLWLARCLRCERGWIDRSLRGVAMIWVLLGIASRMIHPMQYYFYERF